MTVRTLPIERPYDERRALRDERRDLTDRLARVGSDPWMGVLEKSAERRALRERIADIDEELAR